MRSKLLLAVLFLGPAIFGRADAFHDGTIFRAPPFLSASAVLHDSSCDGVEEVEEAAVDGSARIGASVDGLCAWPGLLNRAAFGYEDAITVETGRLYRVNVDYTVTRAYSWSGEKMLHDFFVQLGFEKATETSYPHLLLGDAVYWTAAGRCWTENSECDAGDAAAPGLHHAVIQATANCDGAPICSLDLYAEALAWSSPYPTSLEPRPTKGGAAFQVKIDDISVSSDFREGGTVLNGTVTDDTGSLLEGVCVYIERAAPDVGRYHAVTDASGRYSLEVEGGEYLVRFADCSQPARWVTEWYPDADEQSGARAISVPHHEVTTINASLDRIFAPDLRVLSLRVRPINLRTDAGALPVQPGLRRKIELTIANPSSERWPATVSIRACPRTHGSCEVLHQLEPTLAPGRTSFSHEWTAIGWLGDVMITASVIPKLRPDPVPENNEASADSYVAIGGTGIGLSPSRL